jgi:hypothetical protein
LFYILNSEYWKLVEFPGINNRVVLYYSTDGMEFTLVLVNESATKEESHSLVAEMNGSV